MAPDRAGAAAPAPPAFDAAESFALALDERESRADTGALPLRAEFHVPRDDRGRELAYFSGNSLGLMPRAARAAVDAELDDWARLGAEAHTHGRHPWIPYHEQCRRPAARLVGALEGEAVVMGSLTAKLPLLLASFYRPLGRRTRILIDAPTFPSDRHAVDSQARWRGLDPALTILEAAPRKGEHVIHEEDVEALLRREGDTIALVLLAGVNFFTGQRFDLARLTRAAHAAGAVMGVDLAHSAGNVPLRLHDWDVDFGAWCSYKYLNGGPGSVAGAFVHEKHFRAADERTIPRLEGWWGNDPATRFLMAPRFTPGKGAEAWQVSNPPILSFAPVRVSLEMFDRVGMPALRERSERLTGYLERVLPERCGARVSVLTPADPARRGAQLSIAVRGLGRDATKALRSRGVVADYREPSVVRVAPTPLYNTFHDCWRLADALDALTR